MDKEEIRNKYEEVEFVLENALNDTHDIELVGDEENIELEAINSTLASMNESFKKEIEKLEGSSEWDKFCIAFFGETNAGKSTIIESLRIIYDEETRRQEKLKQIEKYKKVLIAHCNDYQDLIQSLESVNSALELEKHSSMKKIILCVVCTIIGIVIGFLVRMFLFF